MKRVCKIIHHKLKVHCRRNNINRKVRDHILRKCTGIKKLLQTKLKQEAINKFKQYLQNYRAIPAVLKDFIQKHIINHFHRYVEHLYDEKIEKTSNKLKNFYF